MYELKHVKKNGLIYLTSPELQERGIFLAFTTRQKGFSPAPYDSLNLAFHVQDHQQNVIKNRRFLADNLGFDLEKLTCAKQVHGNAAIDIKAENIGRGATDYEAAIDETDALATEISGSPIAMFFADCLPVVLISLEPKKVAIAHAGFKGLLNGVIGNAVALFGDRFPKERMLAFLGPSIGKCCYKVDRKRIADFNNRFGSIVKTDDKALDLKNIAKYQLKTAGLRASNIISADYCTCCNDELFFSFRRNNITGRQAAIALIG